MTHYITHISPRFFYNGGAEIFLRDFSREFNDEVRFRQSICLEHDYYDENFCSTFSHPVIRGGEKEIIEAINRNDIITSLGYVALNDMNLPKPKISIYNLCEDQEGGILRSNKYINYIVACSTQSSKICGRHNIDYNIILPGIATDSDRLKVTEGRNSKRLSLGIKENDFLIGMIARLDDNKRQLALIKVMNLIKHEKIKAIFVGSSNFVNSFGDSYLDHLKSNSTRNNCIFIPHQEKIGNWWNILDCYCMLSQFEGCSASLFESLYFKVPVISTAVGSHLDILTDKNSVLINDVSRDLFGAIIKIHNLTLNKARLNILKDNGYKTFLKFGDIKQTAIQWKDLILKLKNKNDNKE